MKRLTNLLTILSLLVFHYSLQAQIEVAGSVNVASRSAIDAVGSIAYAVGNNTLACINLANPSAPTVMGQVSVGEVSLSSVDVAGNYAFCAGGFSGLVIIRIATPSSPSWVHNFDLPAPVVGVDAYDTLVAVATSANITLVGCRSVGDPHVLATYGHTASSIKMDFPARQIYAGSTGGALSLDININTSGGDTTVTLTARDQFGSGDCSPIALSQPYLDVARGTILTALTATTFTQTGQYTASGNIEAAVAGPGCAFIGVSPASIQFLDQRSATPTFVGSVSISAAPAGVALAQSGDQPLVVVAHTLGVTVLRYTALAVGPETSRPEVPSSISVNAFPNPFNHQTHLQLATLHPGIYTLRVFDILGRELSSKSLWFSGSTIESLDFARYGAGTYYAELSNASVSARIKLLYLP